MAKKIPIKSTHGKISADHISDGKILSEKYFCYICGGKATTSGDYMLGSLEHQQVLNNFRVIAEEIGIKYHIADYDFERIYISACKEHVPNLNKLERGIIDNKGIINKEIIESSLE